MYIFNASYIRMDTNKEIRRKIEVDDQFFDSEKDVYIYAIGRAYDAAGKAEILSNFEFISC